MTRKLTRLTGTCMPERLREVLAELLAEGLPAVGGHPGFEGADAAMAFWTRGKEDNSASAGDMAFLASAVATA